MISLNKTQPNTVIDYKEEANILNKYRENREIIYTIKRKSNLQDVQLPTKKQF